MLSAMLVPFLFFAMYRKKRLDPKWTMILVAAVITAALFIRVESFSLYRWVFEVPGFNSMRSMTRIINVELIFFAFFFAAIIAWLGTKARWTSVAIFAVALPLLCLENRVDPQFTSRTKKQKVQAARYELKAKMKHIPEGSVVSYEPDTIIGNLNYYHIDMMIAAQDLNLKSMNGYTARLPEDYIPYARSLKAEAREQWMHARKNKERVFVVK